jgi:hypothetical protein
MSTHPQAEFLSQILRVRNSRRPSVRLEALTSALSEFPKRDSQRVRAAAYSAPERGRLS